MKTVLKSSLWQACLLLLLFFCGTTTIKAQNQAKVVDLKVEETNSCDILISYRIEVGNVIPNSPTQFFTRTFKIGGQDFPRSPSARGAVRNFSSESTNSTIGPFEERLGIGAGVNRNLEVILSSFDGNQTRTTSTSIAVATPPLTGSFDELEAVITPDLQVLLKWRNNADCLQATDYPRYANNPNAFIYDFQIGWQLKLEEQFPSGFGGSSENDPNYRDFLNNTRYSPGDVLLYKFIAATSGVAYSAETAEIEVTIREPSYDGIISGTLTSRGGQPIPNARVELRKTSSESGFPGVTGVTTDANGFYEFKNIYYYFREEKQETFSVVPVVNSLSFSPNSRGVTLRDAEPIVRNVDFKDQNGFDISGTITQSIDGSSCGVDGVEIRIDGLDQLVFTDSLGNYTIGVDDPGSYVIRPSLENFAFEPTLRSLSITSSGVRNIDFNNTTTRKVSGNLEASCNQYIGQADIRFYSILNGGECFSKTIKTEEGTGRFEVDLPARAYKVEVLNVFPLSGSGLNGDEIVASFETEDINLIENAASLNFTYRKPPKVRISGFPEPDCTSEFSIMEQQEPYEITIRVWEEVDVCAADTGKILILDQISQENPETIEIPFSNGIAKYTVIPGLPNLTGDYTKSINISAIVGPLQADFAQKVIVTGARPRASTFASTSPEVPFLILRDPPGDGSSSYLEEGTTIERSFSISNQLENDNRLWGKLDLGFDFLVGAFVLTEVNVTASLEAGFSAGFSESSSEEKTLSLTSTQRFATNDGDAITGTEGDVFVGAAINLVYAIADVLKVENCALVQDKILVNGTDGFATRFIYTESHIRETLLEQLKELQTITVGVNDSLSAGYANQISIWEQVLQYNDELKDKAIFQENVSFSGGVDFESSTTSSSTESLTLEFTQNLGADVAAELGVNVAGIGFSGGVQSNFRMEFGESETQSTTRETTVGYVLKDDDVGDFFSVDVKTDPVYGTPVFDLISGRSSCPFEAGTQPRDDAQISSEQLIRTGIAADGTAVFNLALANISQSEEDREYRLIFNQATNPDGAEIRVGGSEIQQDGSLFDIGAFQTVTATVTVKRGPAAYSYEGLEFELISECDASIRKKIRLSAFFESPCSPITLTEPAAGWLINQTGGDFLTVKFRDYVIEDLDQVSVQYAPSGTSNWVTGLPVNKSDLLTSEFGTVVDWNISRLQEGAYNIRMKVDCGQGVLYSNITEGMLDRTSPKLFGEPEPVDDEYVAGDRVALTFNEALNCLGVKAENIVLKRKSDGAIITVQVGCSDNRLIILPPASILAETNEIFEITVMNVADKQGNPIEEAIVWEFSIGGASEGSVDTDLDNDSILDAEDNCMLAANPNQADLDNDGIGDACDEDIDGDDIDNEEDNAPFHFNPNQEDNDGNGIGDAAEANGDGDQDGIINSEDNCPTAANANQSDIDSNGIGDACDEDIDGDGILNANDNCPTISNVQQQDEDGNGVGNACEGIVGTKEIALEKGFQLYPNPAFDNVIIVFEEQNNRVIQIAIYDITGKAAFQQKEVLNAGLNNVELPLNLADGMYFVVVNDGITVQSQKLIVATK